MFRQSDLRLKGWFQQLVNRLPMPSSSAMDLAGKRASCSTPRPTCWHQAAAVGVKEKERLRQQQEGEHLQPQRARRSSEREGDEASDSNRRGSIYNRRGRATRRVR